jgi:hypothetical protein
MVNYVSPLVFLILLAAGFADAVDTATSNTLRAMTLLVAWVVCYAAIRLAAESGSWFQVLTVSNSWRRGHCSLSERDGGAN